MLKTNAALIEYLVPGILLLAGLFVVGASASLDYNSLLKMVNAASALALSVQVPLTVLALCLAYVLGMLASSGGGRILMSSIRQAQRRVYMSMLKDRHLAQDPADAERVRHMGSVLRAMCASRSPAAAESFRFHSEHARILRGFPIPFFFVALAASILAVNHSAIRGPALVLAGISATCVWWSANSAVYRQKLLATDTVSFVLALCPEVLDRVLSDSLPLATEPSRNASSLAAAHEIDETIVASDWNDTKPHPISFRDAHSTGTPHRAVHVEVWNGSQVLVWQRRDGRMELPGGHARWLESGPERADEGAARELLEELGAATADELADYVERLRVVLRPVGTCLNQSMGGKNNEWVTVYRIDRGALPGHIRLDGAGELSAEGNRDARWWSVEQVREFGEKNPMRLASSLKLFLDRNRANNSDAPSNAGSGSSTISSSNAQLDADGPTELITKTLGGRKIPRRTLV